MCSEERKLLSKYVYYDKLAADSTNHQDPASLNHDLVQWTYVQ